MPWRMLQASNTETALQCLHRGQSRNIRTSFRPLRITCSRDLMDTMIPNLLIKGHTNRMVRGIIRTMEGPKLIRSLYRARTMDRRMVMGRIISHLYPHILSIQDILKLPDTINSLPCRHPMPVVNLPGILSSTRLCRMQPVDNVRPNLLQSLRLYRQRDGKIPLGPSVKLRLFGRVQ